MTFNIAQTFYIDPTLLQNASQVGISSINLYFRAKPRITGNKSGIYAPGVEVFISPTTNGIPSIDRFGVLTRVPIPLIRREYSQINTSSDASVPTTFKFQSPFQVQTGMQYAIIVCFDGNEDFVLWAETAGKILVGTHDTSPGPSGKYVGNLFTYITPTDTQSVIDAPVVSDDTSATIASTSSQVPLSTVIPTPEYLLQAWKPENTTDLKFDIMVARYAHNGIPVYANTTITSNPTLDIHTVPADFYQLISNSIFRMLAPSYPMEYLTFDLKSSNFEGVVYGDRVYQDMPYYPGGKAIPATVSVTEGMGFANCPANYVLANGSNFIFPMLFNTTGDECIVVTSLNHYGAGQHAVNVRPFRGALTNTSIICAEAFTFTNSAAYFFKSPIARLYSLTQNYLFGKKNDIVILGDSTANDICHFVNDCINSVSISVAGSSYDNSDYVVIGGYEDLNYSVKGGYSAQANIVTNGSGAITAIYLSNAGAGFVNSQNITWSIKAANGGVSNGGTSATLTATVGATLKTELSGGNVHFNNVKIVNIEAVSLVPDLEIENPAGSVYTVKNQTEYFAVKDTNTFSGKAYYLFNDPSVTDIDVRNGMLTRFTPDVAPVLPSRSNQYVIRFANGAVGNTEVWGKYYSNSSMYFIDISSNNDFVAVTVHPEVLNSRYSKYSINNDYTGEHTNYGNALAKAVQVKVSFANNQFAEDLLVYCTAYRPANTDIQIYARIHNSKDTDAFDDHDWTRMRMIDGIGVYSTVGNETDMKEFTWGFQQYGNSAYKGQVATTLSSATITGSGTTFSTQFAVNDLVRIYQPLFPNDDYMVGVVNSIPNNTILTLTQPVVNNNIVGSGLKIDKILYPHQAFNNVLNDNVVRYYNSSMVEYDTYDSFQLKIVLLSDSDYIVPKIDDCRAIGASS